MSMTSWLNDNEHRLFAGQRGRNASLGRCRYFINFMAGHGVNIALGVRQEHLNLFRDDLRNKGKSPSTINNYLSCVSVLLKAMSRATADLKMPFVDVPKARKWHLTDDLMLKVSNYLIVRYGPGERAQLMDDYMEFVAETGLRVEEVLRLIPSDFTDLTGQRPGLNVPGTKTDGSAVWVPISDAARAIVQRRMRIMATKFESLRSIPERRLFDISYKELHACWDDVRKHLGVSDVPTSTLKALRRTFAARALRKGLSPAIIQELMRHASMSTTMGYLRLFGMSDNDETRALLNRQLGPTKYRSLTNTSILKSADYAEIEKQIMAHYMSDDSAKVFGTVTGRIQKPSLLDDFATFFKELYGTDLKPYQRDLAAALMGEPVKAKPDALPPEVAAIKAHLEELVGHSIEFIVVDPLGGMLDGTDK